MKTTYKILRFNAFYWYIVRDDGESQQCLWKNGEWHKFTCGKNWFDLTKNFDVAPDRYKTRREARDTLRQYKQPANLDEVWTKCLIMWRYIVKKWKKNKRLRIDVLKREYLKNNHYVHLLSDCHFCDYCKQCCTNCPGTLVDENFSCINISYNHFYKPDKFLQKIEQLNKKRLLKKEN